MSVIFLFIDGIGLGGKEGENPLYDPKWKSFDELTDGQGLANMAEPVQKDGMFYKPIDANLDVKGLPQSGTGQAALFSGVNASKIAGRHFGPFPHSRTRYLLEEKSLFHQVKDKGFRPHFINAYPDIFFKRMNRKKRWTCTTLMASSAGQSLNGLNEIKEGQAITAEIVQDAWREQLKLDVKKVTPETAAVRLIKALEEYDLVMFEYYLTDKAGHSMNREMSDKVLGTLDRFITHLLKIKNANDHLVISSDHGNLENLAIKTHTRNPVPLIVHGREASNINKAADSIMDVPQVIQELMLQG